MCVCVCRRERRGRERTKPVLQRACTSHSQYLAGHQCTVCEGKVERGGGERMRQERAREGFDGIDRVSVTNTQWMYMYN